jgi:hypothetical protein
VNPNDDHQVKCKYCPTTMFGGINRLKHHLARVVCKDVIVCDGFPAEFTTQMQFALETSKNSNAKRARMKFEIAGMGRSPMAPLGSCSSSAPSPSITSPFFLPCTTPGSQPTLESFNKKKRKEADMAVRRFWYHDNLSFNIAKSPFYQPMVDVIARAGPRYKAPSYSALRGKDIDEELECVKAQLEGLKSSWESTGCTIMSDGWTDQRNRTILNFLVAFPKGTMFLKSIDASSHVKDANLIYSMLVEVVEEVGVKHVVQVITQQCCKLCGSWKIAMCKISYYFLDPMCAAHCIDLILEDIGKLEWVHDIVHECKQITKYIYNHAWVLNLMREFTEGELSHPVAITCFATNFLSLQSLLNKYQALRWMFCSEKWLFWKDNTKPNAMAVKVSLFRDDLWELKSLRLLA